MNYAHLHAYAVKSFRFRLVNTDFCDARFWHRADKLPELKVRYERGADVEGYKKTT